MPHVSYVNGYFLVLVLQNKRILVALLLFLLIVPELAVVDGKVIKEADGSEPLVSVDLDLSKVDDVRKERPYLSNRRPDVYGLLTRLTEE